MSEHLSFTECPLCALHVDTNKTTDTVCEALEARARPSSQQADGAVVPEDSRQSEEDTEDEDCPTHLCEPQRSPVRDRKQEGGEGPERGLWLFTGWPQFGKMVRRFQCCECTDAAGRGTSFQVPLTWN